MALGDIAAGLPWPVFACGADKRPVVSTGFKAATTTRAHILAMFERPGAELIGVPTGAVSGLVVIDIDIRADRTGMDWLHLNASALPETRTHKTRSGGLHLLFNYPTDVEIRNSAGRVALGVDVRGEGGYIIAPPSPGYEVADPSDVADMPLWLIRACLPQEREQRPPAPAQPPRPDGGSRYGLAALARECDAIRSAPYGQQETTLNAAGLKIGALVAGGELQEGIALADLGSAGRDMGSESGREPWSDDDVRTKIARAVTTGMATPRKAPEPKFRIVQPDPPSSIDDPAHWQPLEDEAPAFAPRSGGDRSKTSASSDKGTEAKAGEGSGDKPSAPDRRIIEIAPIQVFAGEIDVTATAGEDALIKSGLPAFRRDKTLVRPVSQNVPASGGRMTIAAGLSVITPPAMVDMLNQAVPWRKWNDRAKAWKPCDPPSSVASVILSRAALSRLPGIAGVITTPTLRPDGSVLMDAGYDAATRLYHVADPALKMPTLTEKPTYPEAQTALGLLIELLAEFPFVDDVSRAVAVSAIITSVVRGAISVAPLHAFRASTAGSGKSYLADIVSMIASGRPCPVMAVAEKDDETEKRLVGLLLAGFPIISLDNVNGELGGDLLCQAIERPLIRARPLGSSEIIEIESRATLLATGNALRVRGDMTRRTLICSLDAKMERPELREFVGNPAETVAKARGPYVAAALTVVRAYLHAGKPMRPPALASFEEWNIWVRGALIWLKCGDPAASMEEARCDDPELAELREMLGVWEDACGIDEGYTTRELDERSQDRMLDQDTGRQSDEQRYPDFRAALIKVAGERGAINTKRLARWFMDREGRFADGLRIKRHSTAQGGLVRWCISRG